MHVKYQLNRDKHVKYHSYVAGHIDAIDHSLPDYIISVLENNYDICYCCYTKSTILYLGRSNGVVTLRKVLIFEGNLISRS